MSTYEIRKKFADIARLDVGNTEQSMNRAPWIAKLWPATSSPEYYVIGNDTYPRGNPPYCAAGVAYCLREWLKLPEVLKALKLTPAAAETWRCKSPGVKEWSKWARRRGLKVLGKNCILKMGDIVIYDYSHIEIVTNDDNTPTGPFVAVGYNTNASASRDGEGCFEKPRIRKNVLEVIRLLEDK